MAHVSFSLMIKGGLKNPKIIRKSVDEIVLKHNKHIMKDIDIPFIIPALDITKRKSIYYSSSPMEKFTYYDDRPISETIRSSSSIPVIFTPNRVFSHVVRYLILCEYFRHLILLKFLLLFYQFVSYSILSIQYSNNFLPYSSLLFSPYVLCISCPISQLSNLLLYIYQFLFKLIKTIFSYFTIIWQIFFHLSIFWQFIKIKMDCSSYATMCY